MTKHILMLAPANSVHTEKWIKGLVESHKVTLLSLHQLNFDLPDGVELKYFNKSVYGITSAIVFANFFVYLNKVQTVHAHYASSYGLLMGLIRCKQKVLSVWGSDVYEFPQISVFHKLLIMFNLWRADVLTSTSHVMANRMAAFTDKFVHVVPFGIDLDRFNNADEKIPVRQKFIIGTIKALDHKYGIDILINAVELIRTLDPKVYSELECHIYGRGSKEDDYRMAIMKAGLGSVVYLKGYIENSTVPYTLRDFDLFVAVSRQESFGVSVVEAMACGVVPLVSNTGGLPEVIGANAGYLVDVDNPVATAEKIISAYYNRTRLDSMSKNGIERVKSNYDFRKNLKEMIRLYL